MADREIKVLLVEDSESDTKQVMSLLRKAPDQHFEITSVKRLQPAIVEIDNSRFDIILLDLGLPDSKGLATLDAIVKECPDMPIVIFTVLGDEEAGIEAINKGAQDYLVKGTSDERILSKSIRYAIERKNLEIEQYRVHEQLRQSEERFRNIFSNAAMGMVEYDVSHRFSSVNDHVCHILGYSREELLGKRVLDITAAEDQELTRTTNELIDSGDRARFDYEKRYIRSDGTYMWAHVTLSAIHDEQGQHILTVGTIEDITERKKTEHELVEKKDEAIRQSVELETVLESLPVGVAIYNTDSSVRKANWFFKVLTPFYSTDDIRQSLDRRIKSVQLFDEDEQPVAVEQLPLYQALHGKTIQNFIAKWVKRDNARWLLVNASPIIVENHIVGAVAGLIDITERKEHDSTLRESEERFRIMADGVPMIIWVSNKDGVTQFVNRTYTEFFGATLEQVEGGNWQPLVHPDDYESYTKEYLRAVREKRPFRAEGRVLRADGVWRWLMSYGEPRYSGDGEFLGHIGLSPDITDRKEAELRLKDSENKLKILNENLESIVIQRTEQVRSLSAALTFAEQRERKRFSYVLHEELQQKLLGARILLNQHTEGHEDLDHGIALLDNAIQITRTLSLELNPPILNTEGLDAALRWLCTYMQNNYKLNVNLQIHGPVDQIRGDAQMIITNMIRELLKNVVNHSGVLKAAVDVTCEHHLIKAIVKDEGKGFDEKKELKKTSEETGFGLFSVRERLNMFGGELQVDSEIGHGTVCTIIYPLTKC